MIINIRGGNGSGKSWVVRQLIGDREPDQLYRTPGRRMHVGEFYGDLFVLGPYYNRRRNGGFDALLLDEGYDILKKVVRAKRARNYLYEGKNQSDDLSRAVALGATLVFLNTPIETCVRQVRERGHTLSENVIEKTWRKQIRETATLKKRGVPYHLLGSRDALEFVREQIR